MVTKADRQRHALWADQLEGVLDLWCPFWAPEKLQHVRAEFRDWMLSCDRLGSRGLASNANYVATALNGAKQGNWTRDASTRAYVFCREQFFGYAAEAYARRFPIHGPWPEEVDDVPF